MNQLQHEQERVAFGDELRTLRRSNGITGLALAKEVGISQSKLSKIETGALVPAADDLVRLLGILNATPAKAKKLREWARTLRTEYVSWRFGHRRGFSAKQIEIAEREQKAARMRVFQTAAIPGLLQTTDYARRVMDLANITKQRDLEKAVGLRMQRQQTLFESGHDFEFLITESAALSRFCDPSIVINQLDRLRFLFGLQNIKIGFISHELQLPSVPQHSFVILDSEITIFESLTGELATIDESDINAYNSVFNEFSSIALYNEEAIGFLESCKQFLRRFA